jgi:Arc/MetJ-type ribon-helix-helix transcriptional regulator
MSDIVRRLLGPPRAALLGVGTMIHPLHLRLSVVRTEVTVLATLRRRLRARRRKHTLHAVVSRRLKLAVRAVVAAGLFASDSDVVRTGVESLPEVKARMRARLRKCRVNPAQTAFAFASGDR